MKTIRCVGCGAEVPDVDGPTHRYMTSAAACWQRYGELLAVLYGRRELQRALTMCVDTYAVQHPGEPGPQATQSVIVHLLNMHSYLVAGRPVGLPQKTFSDQELAKIIPAAERTAAWLEPPPFAGGLTVFDMPEAGDASEIEEAARAWATSTWTAWSVHHARIAQWYAACSRT
jgi:hypothetical protein